MTHAPPNGSLLLDSLLGQVADEFLDRLNRGEHPDVDEYAHRHPELAEVIRRVFPALQVLKPGSGVDPAAPGEAVSTPAPGYLGDFRILREVGRGGMGVVYEAEQVSLRRRVALKVLPFAAALDGKQLQRFKNEAQAAAHLHHQNIVPVYAVGCERGVHYYAMQFIEGHTLAEMIQELRRFAGLEAADQAVLTSAPPGMAEVMASDLQSGKWAPAPRGATDLQPTVVHDASPGTPQAPAVETDVETRGRGDTGTNPVTGSPRLSVEASPFFRTVANLGVQSAEALEYAHQMGVIHRDIKPANLLVDGRGNLWITDFGLAQIQSDPRLTLTGDILGTLRYMSPEQALAKRVIVDHRTDIYSLGVTLYELLTLEPAFNGQDRQEVLRQISFEEPRAPRRLHKSIPVELETIVLKAMAKNPEERYATSGEVADDLERYLKDEPIRAKRPTVLQRARKWVRRHQALVTTAAALTIAFLALAVTGLAVSNVLISRQKKEKEEALAEARRNYDAAQEQRKRAEDASEEHRRHLVRMLVAHGVRLMDEGDLLASLPWFAEALVRDQKDPERVAMHRARLAAVLQQAPRLRQVLFHDGLVTHAQFSPVGRFVATCSHDGTARVWDVANGKPVSPPLRHGGVVWGVAFSPDGGRLVTARRVAGTDPARIWEVRTGKELATLAHGSGATYAEFSTDGSRVVTAGGNFARVWNAATGEAITPPLTHRLQVWQASFSPDRRWVLTASGAHTPPGTHEGEARVWDAATGEPVTPPFAQGDDVRWAWFSPDGRRVVTSNNFGEARVWEVPAGKLVTTLGGSHPAGYAVFSPDGGRIATGGQFGTARVWDAATGKAVTPVLKHASAVTCVAFSPDGLTVLTACLDGTVRLWDAGNGQPVAPPMYHGGAVMHAAFSPSGRRLVTASHDHSARIWDLDGHSGLVFFQRIPGVGSQIQAVFSPDGRQVLTWGETQPTRIWDLDTGKQLVLKHNPELLRLGSGVSHAAFSRDGRLLLTTHYDDTAQVWDATKGEPVARPFKHEGDVLHGSFSPDGRCVVTASEDRTARVWSVATGAPITRPLKHESLVRHAVFSPDGRWVLTASHDQTARIWDAATGEPALTLKLAHAVYAASFSPDGQRVVTACGDGTAQVWDAVSGKPVGPPLRHGAVVTSGSFSPNGRWVVTASGGDSTARVWDAATGQPVTPPLEHSFAVMGAVFSPDSRRVVTAARDSTARVWDAATGEPLTPPLKHSAWVRGASFSPDGRRVVTACVDRTVRVWELPADDRPVPDLVLLAQLLSASRFDAKGGLVRLEPAELKAAWQMLRSKYPDEFSLARRPGKQ